MPSRVIPFVNGEFYHVFNRGVAKVPIFNNVTDYKRFLKSMLYYQIKGPKPRLSLFNPKTINFNSTKKIVNIICYCLMPNHFHLLLEQAEETGITEFLSRISNSYTKYFNIKNNRQGPLFQGEFKAIHIETTEQLLHVSRYIHLNPLVDYIIKSIEKYPWSSYSEYVGLNNFDICSKEFILGEFESLNGYELFVLNQEDYGKKLEMVKHQLIDYE